MLVLWLLRWLLFRLEFGAGLIKMRGDRCWRDLTCLDYHHETQPMPGPLSWYFHHLPPWLHNVEVAANHITQLIVPFAAVRAAARGERGGRVVIVTQGWLVLSGNFSWLNCLAITLACHRDRRLAGWLPPRRSVATPPAWYGAVVARRDGRWSSVLSYRPGAQPAVARSQVMNCQLQPVPPRQHLRRLRQRHPRAQRGGHRGHRRRTPRPDTDWREYEFKGKPGDPCRRPPQVAPYHLRLDWLLWFCRCRRGTRAAGLPVLVTEVARRRRGGYADCCGTTRSTGSAPHVCAGRLYHYRFTTPAERPRDRRVVGEGARGQRGPHLPPR